MSSFRDKYSVRSSSDKSLPQVLQDLQGEAPCVAEVLSGRRSEDGAGWEVWPATIMVFIEVDRMKFCLNPQEGPQIAFGCVEDPCKLLQSLEQALQSGAFEWKKRKAKGWTRQSG